MKRLSLYWFSLLLLFIACNNGGKSTPNQSPIASFTTAITDLTVNFDASGSSDPDGSITNYAWDFGDGQTGNGVTTNHSYQNANTFLVQLTVTDNSNNVSAKSENIIVTAPRENKGAISGQISVRGNALTQVNFEALPKWQGFSISELSWQHHPKAEFVPGELIVKFKNSEIQPSSIQLHLQSDNYSISHVRNLANSNTQLYSNSNLDGEATLSLASELSKREDILYVHPNYIWKAFTTPNDEFFDFQWHYNAINLSDAWDITKGLASTIVAVIDTGILFDANDSNLTHPDFVGKILAGYDFISNPNVSKDGDGRDANPFDVGDDNLTYHGSHVAGTIAATTNNTEGVAGINWEAKILPVRVLGVGGGSLTDILEGSLWAAGLHPSIVNPNPASILNLSLGGPGLCPAFVQEVYDQIIAAGKTVVVAAGNENQNAGGFMPASCRGVITTGATDLLGNRAHYSNFGSRIDVMAPGGDTRPGVDVNNDGQPDGVLSTILDSTNNFNYSFYQGTSMATPHIAGVISLMQALKSDLTPAQALSVLKSTARPLSASQCPPNDCGAGLIDALAALQAVQKGDFDQGKGILSFNPQLLDFGGQTNELNLGLKNTGDRSLSYKLLGYKEAPDNPAKVPQGVISRAVGNDSGNLSVGEDTTIRLRVDRSLLSATGFYQLELGFEVNDGITTETLFLPVRIIKPKDEEVKLSGPMIVAAFVRDANGVFQDSGFQVSQGVISNYNFEALAGENFVIAWSDENNNVKIDEGDFLGAFPTVVNVTANQTSSGVDIVLEPSAGISILSESQITFLEDLR